MVCLHTCPHFTRQVLTWFRETFKIFWSGERKLVYFIFLIPDAKILCWNQYNNDIWAFQYFESSQYLTDFLVQLKRWIRVKWSWMKVFLLERHPKFPPVSSFQDNAPMTSQRNHLLFNSTEFMKRDLLSLSMIPPPIPGKERGGVRKDDEKTLGMLEAIPTRKKHRTIVS